MFTAKAGVDWPYDFKQLQTQMVDKVSKKLDGKVTVTADAPASGGAVDTVDGQITRMYQANDLDGHSGGVSSNTEVITVHYWVTDAGGKKVVDKTRTYNSGSTGSFSDAEIHTPGPMANDLEGDVAAGVKSALSKK